MERSVTKMVPFLQVKTFLLEVVDRDGLVTLNCRMQYGKTSVALNVNVSAILD